MGFHLQKLHDPSFQKEDQIIFGMIMMWYGETSYLTPGISFFSCTFRLCCWVRESHYQWSLQEHVSSLNQNVVLMQSLSTEKNNKYLINGRHGFNHFFCERPSNASRSNQNIWFYGLVRHKKTDINVRGS